MGLFSLFKKNLKKPYVYETPVRESVYNQLNEIYGKMNSKDIDLFDAMYMSFTIRLIASFDYKQLHAGEKDWILKDRVFIYYLPLYCSYLSIHAQAMGYMSEKYAFCLRACADKFLHEYCVVTGTDYDAAEKFFDDKIKQYHEFLCRFTSKQAMGCDVVLIMIGSIFAEDLADVAHCGRAMDILLRDITKNLDENVKISFSMMENMCRRFI